VRGRIVASWGDPARKINVRSVRKSFLSALIGMSVEAGAIDLGATLEQLGIDETPPLTAAEKQATVVDLLTSRSGVYRPAEREDAYVAAQRPPPGSHPPGAWFYYNNWDFNALGTIFERRAGLRVGEAFQQRIAAPLGMDDFSVDDVEYVRRGKSDHPAYSFRMSARDMARFGLLYLREGTWGDRRIISPDWVRESTATHVPRIGARFTQPADGEPGSWGYGYMWWTPSAEGSFYPRVSVPSGTYAAAGNGGHHIVVVPAADMVVVHRVDNDVAPRRVDEVQFGYLLHLLLEAAGVPQPAREWNGESVEPPAEAFPLVPAQAADALDERARRALTAAREEARRRGDPKLGGEHLLLALLADDTCGAARLLREAGVAQAAARSMLDAWVAPRAAASNGPTDETSRLRLSLALAARDATATPISTKHLLAGLSAVPTGMAAWVLTRLSVDLVQLRAAALAETPPIEVQSPGAPAP
jgi:CubicO group peptidase (beta-lactamase class C family)